MQIQVIHERRVGQRMHFELATEKKSAFISYNGEHGWIDVCCQNAMHQAWRGMGRTFHSFDQALAAYKSSDMKAMIEFVREHSSNETAAKAEETFHLEREPAARPAAAEQFRNNTKADGSPLSQMVLFSGSQTCVAGQQDLFDLAGDQ